MIKAIVFDFDGMVFHSSDLFSNRLHREFGIEMEKIIPFFKNSLADCQKGLKDLKDEVEPFVSDWGFDDVNSLLNYWFNDGALDNEMVVFIKELKVAGVVSVLATNNEKYRFEYLNEKFKLNELFDHVVVSYKLGYRKPEKLFYENVLKLIGFNSDEVIICDDRKEHVKEILSMGLKSIFFENLGQFREELNEIISFS
ncbi:MAG: HAD-IA family hydrolase [Nanoarchaeota archaeon]|nr:HAD-IA family hydrolase [Nanoarchaeota archaeon]